MSPAPQSPASPHCSLRLASISSMFIPAWDAQVNDHSGVDVAAARSHDQALERGQTHGRVHALAVRDGGCARAVSEV